MRPYGIVVFPEQGNSVQVMGRVIENGLAPRGHDDDDLPNGGDFPIAVFYETENGRNREMEELLRIYPGIMFCPITLTRGKKTQPSPNPAEFTISNRGVLPA